MSLYKEPRATLLNLLEQENDIDLNPEDYDFTAPQPATPPEGSDASYNTAITIMSNNPAAPYIGEVEVYYNRLDLADLALLADIYVHTPDVATTHGVLPSLNRRYGLNLKEEDVEDLTTVDKGNYRIASLVATATSIGWIGSLDIGIVEGDLLLEEHLTETTLGGLNYPTETLDLPFAHFYSYWRSFSDYHDYLDTVAAGDPITLEIVSALNEVTDDPWSGTGPAQYSLAEAEIVYAGATADYPMANDDYTGVVVIRLSPTQCTGMTGDLILHHSADPYATLGL